MQPMAGAGASPACECIACAPTNHTATARTGSAARAPVATRGDMLRRLETLVSLEPLLWAPP